MTTAARPTFDPARGGQGRGEKDLSSISKQYSSRDLPSHTKLKYRDLGQGTIEELRDRDFRKELEEREDGAKDKSKSRHLAVEAAEPVFKKPKVVKKISAASLDKDDPMDDDDSDSESDEDDTDALMAELQRIRKERAADQVKKQLEDERIRKENVLHGNPLLSYAEQSAKKNMKVRRGWDDDVIFKNCARSEPKKKNEFINDTLRSEFHKKFLEKYVK